MYIHMHTRVVICLYVSVCLHTSSAPLHGYIVPCFFVSAFIYTYYTHMYSRVRICLYVSMCQHRVHLSMCTWCKFLFSYVFVHVAVFVYIYMHICIRVMEYVCMLVLDIHI